MRTRFGSRCRTRSRIAILSRLDTLRGEPDETEAGHEPVHGTGEIAAVGLDQRGNVLENGLWHRRTAGHQGAGGASIVPAQDAEPDLGVDALPIFYREAAGEPRSDAIIEMLEVLRWPISGDHDLPACRHHRVDGVRELLLDRFALKELGVVDEQDVDVAEPLLEGEHCLRLQR